LNRCYRFLLLKILGSCMRISCWPFVSTFFESIVFFYFACRRMGKNLFASAEIRLIKIQIKSNCELVNIMSDAADHPSYYTVM
jgi:hypothetical protein